MDRTCEITAEQSISRMFTASRLLAILTIISAHINIKNSEIISNFYSAIGSIGVIVFLIAAGYYFKPNKQPIHFIKKKAVSIAIPWIVLGSMVYVVNSILIGSRLGILSWIGWLVGYKTYLYFVPVILICFVLFYYHNLPTLIVAMGLNVVSLSLTSAGILEPVVKTLHITNYLNFFNWIGFFAVGILLRRIPYEKCITFFTRTRIPVLCFSIFGVVLVTFTEYRVGYFSSFGWVFELICAWSVFGVCTCKRIYNKFSVSVSETSYGIYILHMMFVGILGKIYSVHPIVSVFANIIVMLFTHLVLLVGRRAAKKLDMERLYSCITGIRSHAKRT